MPKIIDEVKALYKEGNTAKQIRGYLAFKHQVEGKDATKVLEEAGVSTKAAGKGLGQVLLYLQEEPRTERDLYQFIIDHGTKNEARWIAQRNSIRQLSVAVFQKCGVDFEEQAATKNQRDKIKAIVEE